MSRKKSQRLRLFERGNKVCPLCLRGFSEDEVAAGRTVNLEHALAQRALGGSSRPICLTCRSCNCAASNIEQRVGRFEKFGPKVDMSIPSVGRLDVLKARLGESDSQLVLTVRAPEDPADFDVFRTVFRQGLRVESAKLTVLDPQVAQVPYLKAVYLAVFSLLGRFGECYARSPGGELVRGQIARPAAPLMNIPVHQPDPGSLDLGDDFVAISQTYDCWVVRLSGRFVFLPPPHFFGPTVFHAGFEPANGWPLVFNLSERVDLAWPVQEFGRQPVGALWPDRLVGGLDAIRQAAHGRIFGCTGEFIEDRTLYKYVTTDLMGDVIPFILTERRPLTPLSATP